MHCPPLRRLASGGGGVRGMQLSSRKHRASATPSLGAEAALRLHARAPLLQQPNSAVTDLSLSIEGGCLRLRARAPLLQQPHRGSAPKVEPHERRRQQRLQCVRMGVG